MMLELMSRGRPEVVETAAAPDGVLVRAGDQTVAVGLEPAAGSQWWRLTVNGHSSLVRLAPMDGGVVVTLGMVRVPVAVRRWLPVPSRRERAATGGEHVEVRAPMPGLVVETRVAVGEAIAPGVPVAIVEAMKMQMEIPAPAAGRVAEVRVRAGQEVAGGQVLVVVRPLPAPEADR